MKNHLFSALAISLITGYYTLSTCETALAQAPQGIPYQAIARNASGVAIANTAVKVRFSIRDSIATGPVRYQETHSPTTSVLGLFTVNVGMGSVVSGNFSGINWGRNAKFLQVELNTTGGTTYTDLGTTQMMSVPFALQANSIKMRTSSTGDTLYTGGGNYLIIPGLSGSNPILNQPEAPVTDIDGNVYQTVRIGTQVWMKENLKVSRYRNTEPIPTSLTSVDWQNTINGAYSFLNNDVANNATYGKLYNWYAVADSRGLCPVGWHVPNYDEWIILENFLGGSCAAGGKLKSMGDILSGTGLWQFPNFAASNSSGFSALPGGYRHSSSTTYNVNNGFWWTSYESSATGAGFRTLDFNSSCTGGNFDGKKFGFSVRCIKD